MKIVVSANGPDLDAPASPVFGRCSALVFVDTDTMAFEVLDNPAVGAPGGAGIQAAQFAVEKGSGAVLTGNVGPNAFQVFAAANCLSISTAVARSAKSWRRSRPASWSVCPVPMSPPTLA